MTACCAAPDQAGEGAPGADASADWVKSTNHSEIKLVRVKILGWFVNVRICENGMSTFDSDRFVLEINGRAGDTSGFVQVLSKTL